MTKWSRTPKHFVMKTFDMCSDQGLALKTTENYILIFSLGFLENRGTEEGSESTPLPSYLSLHDLWCDHVSSLVIKNVWMLFLKSYTRALSTPPSSVQVVLAENYFINVYIPNRIRFPFFHRAIVTRVKFEGVREMLWKHEPGKKH